MLARRTLLLIAFCLPGSCLAQADSNAPRFAVNGRVHKPGSYELREGMRVVDGLKMAGDFRDEAQIGRVKIIRGRERISFNYAQFVVGKRPEQNILLENGDVIIVP